MWWVTCPRLHVCPVVMAMQPLVPLQTSPLTRCPSEHLGVCVFKLCFVAMGPTRPYPWTGPSSIRHVNCVLTVCQAHLWVLEVGLWVDRSPCLQGALLHFLVN